MFTIVRPAIAFDLPWARPFVQMTGPAKARFLLYGVEQCPACPEPPPCPEPTLYRFPEGYTYADLKIIGSRIRAVDAGDEPCPIVLRKPCY
jgi:hypothetical protein